MITFPDLQSGAVVQYPAKKTITFSSQVVRFLDGSEQRYRLVGKSRLAWTVQLDLLNEQELSGLMDFVSTTQGSYGRFTFIDPADGMVYPSCYLEEDALDCRFEQDGRGGLSLVIREGEPT